MVYTCSERRTISVGDTEILAVDFTPHLDSGETLTGTPTIVELVTTDLTLASKAVNSATYTDSDTGRTVAIGKALQCTVSGGTAAHSPYTIKATCGTTSTPARTINVLAILSFE